MSCLWLTTGRGRVLALVVPCTRGSVASCSGRFRDIAEVVMGQLKYTRGLVDHLMSTKRRVFLIYRRRCRFDNHIAASHEHSNAASKSFDITSQKPTDPFVGKPVPLRPINLRPTRRSKRAAEQPSVRQTSMVIGFRRGVCCLKSAMPRKQC